jgi:hypothetical protein
MSPIFFLLGLCTYATSPSAFSSVFGRLRFPRWLIRSRLRLFALLVSFSLFTLLGATLFLGAYGPTPKSQGVLSLVLDPVSTGRAVALFAQGVSGVFLLFTLYAAYETRNGIELGRFRNDK